MRKLNGNNKVYAIDIDGTICKPFNYKTFSDEEYIKRKPMKDMVAKVNKLYDAGNTIILNTARNWCSHKVTQEWLKKHDIRFHSLVMGKVLADYYVDDKNMTFKEFLIPIKKRGFTKKVAKRFWGD